MQQYFLGGLIDDILGAGESIVEGFGDAISGAAEFVADNPLTLAIAAPFAAPWLAGAGAAGAGAAAASPWWEASLLDYGAATLGGGELAAGAAAASPWWEAGMADYGGMDFIDELGLLGADGASYGAMTAEPGFLEKAAGWLGKKASQLTTEDLIKLGLHGYGAYQGFKGGPAFQPWTMPSAPPMLQATRYFDPETRNFGPVSYSPLTTGSSVKTGPIFANNFARPGATGAGSGIGSFMNPRTQMVDHSYVGEPIPAPTQQSLDELYRELGGTGTPDVQTRNAYILGREIRDGKYYGGMKNKGDGQPDAPFGFGGFADGGLASLFRPKYDEEAAQFFMDQPRASRRPRVDGANRMSRVEIDRSKKEAMDPGAGMPLAPFRRRFDERFEIETPVRQMASGGFVGGMGDGMSDSILTSIEGLEPASLSQGEYVVPADVVSHLGNGSTQAGAKRMEDMIQRIRQARTGRASQAPAIRPEDYLP